MSKIIKMLCLTCGVKNYPSSFLGFLRLELKIKKNLKRNKIKTTYNEKFIQKKLACCLFTPGVA